MEKLVEIYKKCLKTLLRIYLETRRKLKSAIFFRGLKYFLETAMKRRKKYP